MGFVFTPHSRNEPGNALKIVLEWPILATGKNADDVHANLIHVQSRVHETWADQGHGFRKSVRAFTALAPALDFLNVMHDAVYFGKKVS